MQISTNDLGKTQDLSKDHRKGANFAKRLWRKTLISSKAVEKSKFRQKIAKKKENFVNVPRRKYESYQGAVRKSRISTKDREKKNIPPKCLSEKTIFVKASQKTRISSKAHVKVVNYVEGPKNGANFV